MTPVDIAQGLRDAAELIDEYGWTQGAMYRASSGASPVHWTGSCAMSALGAIHVVAGDDPDPLLDALAPDILQPGLSLVQSLAAWNDDPDRTADDVTALF